MYSVHFILSLPHFACLSFINWCAKVVLSPAVKAADKASGAFAGCAMLDHIAAMAADVVEAVDGAVLVADDEQR